MGTLSVILSQDREIRVLRDVLGKDCAVPIIVWIEVRVE